MAKSEIKELAVNQLRVDPTIQRPLDPRRVATEAAQFNPEGLGVLTVSNRGNGEFVLLDGQHRMEIVKSAVGSNYRVKCEIFTGLTKEEEAAIFRVRNNMRRVRQIDQFRVRLVEGDSVASKINAIITGNGWALGFGNTDTHFTAIAVAERVFRLDPESEVTALEKAIATATKAWGHAPSAMDGRIIEGLGILFARHKGAVNPNDLAERLAQFSGGPNALIGRARSLADTIKIRKSHAVAEILTGLYNQRRRTSAIPAWRS